MDEPLIVSKGRYELSIMALKALKKRVLSRYLNMNLTNPDTVSFEFYSPK